MTNTEFINEFDIFYNNIKSNEARGIDNYELSVLLTKAQEQLVFNFFNPLGNKYGKGFENTEKRRRDLKKLVKNFFVSELDVNVEINEDGFAGFKNVVIEIPSKVFFIIQEEAKISGISSSVLPIKHDELMLQKSNPYRKPLVNSLFSSVWRLDSAVNDTFEETIELIIPKILEFEEYSMRYVKKPRPIIVTDLNDGEFTGMNLSVDGISEETTCELDDIMHRQILDRAVELALEASQRDRLQSFPQVASRNE